MSTTIVYAIPNCNTVKKALDWMKANKQAYSFHDYKKLGISNAQLTNWSKQVGWEALINKKGTTWRKLTEVEQAHAISNQENLIETLIAQPSLIKRPVLQTPQGLVIGFDEAAYHALSA